MQADKIVRCHFAIRMLCHAIFIALMAAPSVAQADAGLPSLDQIDGHRATFAIGYDDIPKHTIDAFVAAEDQDYWKRKPNPFGDLIVTQTAQILLSELDDRQIRRSHLQRLAFTGRLWVNYSREQILEIMLNRVYLGRSAFGLEDAAQVYFAKSASELDLAESAQLAALMRAPSRFSDSAHAEQWKARRDYVLGRMERMGWITEAEHDDAVARPLQN